MPSSRSTVDQDVERAFHLLQHCVSLLQPSRRKPDPDLVNARRRLIGVMRLWLTPELVSKDRLLADVAASLSKRTVLTKLLSEATLMKARIACLRRVADEEIRTRLKDQTPTAVCKEEIEHWRTLLPYVRRKPDGSRYIERVDVQAAMFQAMYWSGDLTSFPSWRGASYSLAAACDALARWAHSESGMTTERLRPMSTLVHRLQEHPDWRHVDQHDMADVVSEQVELARDVEELLVELDIAMRPMHRDVSLVAADGSGAISPSEVRAPNEVQAESIASAARPPSNNGVADHPPAALRVSYHEALRGRPDLGLPRTAKTTLRTWCQDPQAAADLGVNPKGKVAAQRPLVDGLIRMHAQKSTRRQPPQKRQT